MTGSIYRLSNVHVLEKLAGLKVGKPVHSSFPYEGQHYPFRDNQQKYYKELQAFLANTLN